MFHEKPSSRLSIFFWTLRHLSPIFDEFDEQIVQLQADVARLREDLNEARKRIALLESHQERGDLHAKTR